MERSGHIPLLAQAWTAKRRMEGRHKTNGRDARGLARRLRNGTLPVVWIPPTERRDERERLRWRMYRSGMRTRGEEPEWGSATPSTSGCPIFR